jgi:hypothetical protein
MALHALPHKSAPRETGASQPHARSTRHTSPRLREGVRAGLLGATGIWIWLFIVDVITGRLLYTPGRIGRDLLGIIFPGVHTPLWADVLAFTLVHYALWALVGTLIVRAIAADARTPGVLLLVVFVLILLQLGFVGWTEILNETALRGSAWWAIFGGSLVGWLITGLYLRRHHPDLPAQLRRDSEV